MGSISIHPDGPYWKYKERPCPGCGDVANRPEQVLCEPCRRLLSLGIKRAKELAAMDGSPLTQKVGLYEGFKYWPPRCPAPGVMATGEFLRNLAELAQLEKEDRFTKTDVQLCRRESPSHSREDADMVVWATQRQITLLQEILDYLAMMFEDYWTSGYNEGRSIFVRLATAGIGEINAMTVKATGREGGRTR